MARASWFVARASESLPEACRELLRLLPGREAAPMVLYEYCVNSARVYRDIAEIDRENRTDALAFARCEELRAVQCYKLFREKGE